jgi:hypothetical protein
VFFHAICRWILWRYSPQLVNKIVFGYQRIKGLPHFTLIESAPTLVSRSRQTKIQASAQKQLKYKGRPDPNYGRRYSEPSLVDGPVTRSIVRRVFEGWGGW